MHGEITEQPSEIYQTPLTPGPVKKNLREDLSPYNTLDPRPSAQENKLSTDPSASRFKPILSAKNLSSDKSVSGAKK